MRREVVVLVVAAVLALLPGCGSDEEGPQTITVPGDAATIQEAVDQADPGALVLVEPGTYDEAVTIDVEGLELRGLDRNEVVLDGGDDEANGITVTADDVAVRNLSVRRFTSNGVYITGTQGFAVDHVTTANNGLYGIYALGARYGAITDSWASGHPDSGIYVGQCEPCDTIVTGSTGERNAIGFLATNTNGGMVVEESTWRDNRVGISVSSQDAEYGAPQVQATVRGNVVEGNDDADAPGSPTPGVGILIAGGQDDLVVDNELTGHPVGGIVVTDLPDGYVPNGTQVVDNQVDDAGPGLVYALVAEERGDQPQPAGVCFSGNEVATTVPPGLQEQLPCPAGGAGGFTEDPTTFPDAEPGGRYQDEPLPADQPSLEGAADAPRLRIAHEPVESGVGS